MPCLNRVVKVTHVDQIDKGKLSHFEALSGDLRITRDGAKISINADILLERIETFPSMSTVWKMSSKPEIAARCCSIKEQTELKFLTRMNSGERDLVMLIA